MKTIILLFFLQCWKCNLTGHHTESMRVLEICVEKVGSAEIAPGVTVNIVVVEISDKHLGTIGFILNV